MVGIATCLSTVVDWIGRKLPEYFYQVSINKIVLSELKEVSDSLIAFGEIQRYERTTAEDNNVQPCQQYFCCLQFYSLIVNLEPNISSSFFLFSEDKILIMSNLLRSNVGVDISVPASNTTR